MTKIHLAIFAALILIAVAIVTRPVPGRYIPLTDLPLLIDTTNGKVCSFSLGASSYPKCAK